MSENGAKCIIQDISLAIHTGFPVWPGDPGVLVDPDARLETVGFNTSRIFLGTHTATHVDAPRHYLADGLALDDIPIERWSGPCHVSCIPDDISIVTARDLVNARIPAGTTHLLLKTRNSSLWNRPLPWAFEPDFVGIDATAAQWIVDHSVALVGIDYLGIATFNEPGHATHLTLLRNDILILEGLDLRAIEPGPYHLTCLPLRVSCVDGAPARAILSSIP